MPAPSSSSLDRALASHREALSACRACGVAEVVGSEVLPIVSLARRPRVMLVGQAPGRTEIVDQRPFAGRAGKTLFRWLERAGVSESEVRERIYIAAITRCYPGPSPSGRGDRVPSPRERELCAGWLDAELELIRPAVIVPVGRLAIDRVLESARLPLDELIGKEHVASGTPAASRSRSRSRTRPGRAAGSTSRGTPRSSIPRWPDCNFASRNPYIPDL